LGGGKNGGENRPGKQRVNKFGGRRDNVLLMCPSSKETYDKQRGWRSQKKKGKKSCRGVCLEAEGGGDMKILLKRYFIGGLLQGKQRQGKIGQKEKRGRVRGNGLHNLLKKKGYRDGNQLREAMNVVKGKTSEKKKGSLKGGKRVGAEKRELEARPGRSG